MGRAYGMYGGEERYMQDFVGKPKGNRPLQNKGGDGGMRKLVFKTKDDRS